MILGRGPTREYHKVLNEDYVNGTLTCLKKCTITRVVNNRFPNILNIEPTNLCNLRCIYCPREKAKKGIGTMDWTLFTKIVDEASEHEQLIMLNLHKDGESFLHPRFTEMVQYAKKKNIAKTIHVNTNALCWSDNTIDRILNSGIDDITVSLDAANPKTYQKHKGLDLLTKAEKNVLRFFERRTQLGLNKPFVRVKIMEFSDISHEELKEFHDKWTNIADMVQVTGIHNWGGAIANLQITDESSSVRYPCALVWYSLVINWNGEVTVCSVDWDTQINVGNVKKQSLHAIWNAPQIKHVRRCHLFRKLDDYPICQKCVVWAPIGDLTEWFYKKREFYEVES